MQVFDFDNTIYDGESSLDFFLFCLKRKKSLIRHLPPVIYNLIRYKIGYVDIETVYRFADRMLKVFFENRSYADNMIKEFCAKYSYKLKPEILALVKPEDAVISASPRFLLDGFAQRIPAETLICTEAEGDRLTYLCYGKNKIKAFYSHYGNQSIDAFYTDSVNDAPMVRAAKRAYLVNGTKIKEIDPISFGKEKYL